MTTADKIGTIRFWQGLGYSYAEMFRGGFTASALATGLATWLGMGKAGSIALGVASLFFWPSIAIVFGYVVWRWRITHAELQRTADNTPFQRDSLALLREIRNGVYQNAEHERARATVEGWDAVDAVTLLREIRDRLQPADPFPVKRPATLPKVCDAPYCPVAPSSIRALTCGHALCARHETSMPCPACAAAVLGHGPWLTGAVVSR